MTFKITQVWMFVLTNEKGEGVCTASLHPNFLMPLIAADEERLNGLLPVAEQIAAETNQTIKLIKFTTREEIMEIKP